MRHMVGASIVVLCWLMLFPDAPTVSAYNKHLTPEQIKEAVEYGKSRRGKDLAGDGSPYVLEFSRESFATVYTPWLAVASAARRAAIEYREPTEGEIRAALSDNAGRVRVTAFVIETTDGFWRDFHAVIIQHGKTFQPSSKRGTYMKVVSCYQRPCSIQALLSLEFSDSLLDVLSDAELVLVLSGGRTELRSVLRFASMQ